MLPLCCRKRFYGSAKANPLVMPQMTWMVKILAAMLQQTPVCLMVGGHGLLRAVQALQQPCRDSQGFTD